MVASPAPKPGPPVEKATPPKRFISEGVRIDIELHGETIDPSTGEKLTKADL